ncbi:hypothetical protein [Paenibacillus prosopidis]|uniref:Uncharacterized protein n=1 Tax=Paenibacillus prosopidis TaxID=630520 RepID=A0A368VT74_9BACL|nr:hypothetical protein [Paenibacillus prosopidis]RCW44966.1 hypothetical protein DFP97_111193 [Paenibacillus prosopidis]
MEIIVDKNKAAIDREGQWLSTAVMQRHTARWELRAVIGRLPAAWYFFWMKMVYPSHTNLVRTT